MRFANPHLLWLLMLVPLLAVFHWWALRRRQQLMILFVRARLLPGLTSGLSPARRKARTACLLGAVACLALAAARPQWGFAREEINQSGVDIVVALDISKSMLAADIAPDRLRRAKLAALDLVREARLDRLGLVAFAGSAFLLCPLTIDDVAFRQSLENLEVNSISEGGTDLAAAIETALTAFKQEDTHKALVILSDGEDHSSGALAAARKAAAAGLRIYTVGVGTPEGELLHVPQPDGTMDYARDEQGNVIKSRLNESLLQGIASEAAGGFYLPLRGASTMETLYREGPARLPKSERQEKYIRQYFERYQWPLTAAILLLLIEILLPERARTPVPGHPRAAIVGALMLATILGVSSTGASPSGALREYQAGRYDSAFQEYQRLLKKRPDDSLLHFNSGAAAYQGRDFEQAANDFEQALSAPDLSLQQKAYYNRGNTLFRLGEKNTDPQQRSEMWNRSLKDFESSLKLNPQDTNALHNQAFVKRMLEELKQQQQQQPSQGQDQNQNDQNQQQDQQQAKQAPNPRQPDGPNPQPQSPEQSQPQSPPRADQESARPDQQDPADEQNLPQPSESPEDSPKEHARAPTQKSEESQDQSPASSPSASGQMTREQAKQLLNSEKADEQALPFRPEAKSRGAPKPIRDW